VREFECVEMSSTQTYWGDRIILAAGPYLNTADLSRMKRCITLLLIL